MSRNSSRWIALCTSSVVSLLALWAALEWRGRSDDEDLILVESDVDGALAVRSTFDPGSVDPETLAREPWLAYVYHVPEAAAEKLFPQLDSPALTYDPWCGFIYKPHQATGRPFPELPGGRFDKRTNSLGLRPETDPRPEKPELRVVVTGDSHVDGICNTDQTYPAVLEHLLGEDLGASNVEVLNAGEGAYSFFNYLGMLERCVHLGLQPDLFVMTVFGGNDFTGILSQRRYFDPTVEGGKSPEYSGFVKLLKKAEGRLRSSFGQGVSSAGYLHYFPDEVDSILAAAGELTLQAQRRCDELGIQFLVVYLPSPAELPGQADFELVKAGLAQAALGLEALEGLTLLRTRYVQLLEREGVDCLDLYDGFRDHQGLLFWKQDLHLNLDGQRLAAQLVEPEVRRKIGR